MTIDNVSSARSLELPICPFCSGKVYYKNWTTHKIFQIVCNSCGSHWRTVLDKTSSSEIYFELIKSNFEDINKDFLNSKKSIEFWRDLLIKKIKI